MERSGFALSFTGNGDYTNIQIQFVVQEIRRNQSRRHEESEGKFKESNGIIGKQRKTMTRTNIGKEIESVFCIFR